jgi:hypothetical protein
MARPASGPVDLGHGDGPVHLDDRGGGLPGERLVQGGDLPPVAGLVQVQVRNGRLERVGPGAPSCHGPLQQRSALVDMPRVPEVAVLVVEGDDLPVAKTLPHGPFLPYSPRICREIHPDYAEPTSGSYSSNGHLVTARLGTARTPGLLPSPLPRAYLVCPPHRRAPSCPGDRYESCRHRGQPGHACRSQGGHPSRLPGRFPAPPWSPGSAAHPGQSGSGLPPGPLGQLPGQLLIRAHPAISGTGTGGFASFATLGSTVVLKVFPPQTADPSVLS